MNDLIPSLAFTALLDLHPTYRDWETDTAFAKEVMIELTHHMELADAQKHPNLHEVAAEWITGHFTAQPARVVVTELLDARSSLRFYRTHAFSRDNYRGHEAAVIRTTQLLLVTGQHKLLELALDVARLDDQLAQPFWVPEHLRAHLPERRRVARERLRAVLRASEAVTS